MSINLKTSDWAKSKKLQQFYFPEITSTNDVAKLEFPKMTSDFCLFVADHQTAGRGRNQNHWFNLSQGETLLSTWCFRLNQSPQPIMPPLVGLSLYQSLKTIFPELPLRLKAPNDLYLNQGKLAGFLMEVQQKGSHSLVYIGLGLNALGSPEVNMKTESLSSFSDQVLEKWPTFCDLFYANLKNALTHGCQKELNNQQRLELKDALNATLPAEKQYSEVSARCDLHSAAGVISWMDL